MCLTCLVCPSTMYGYAVPPSLLYRASSRLLGAGDNTLSMTPPGIISVLCAPSASTTRLHRLRLWFSRMVCQLPVFWPPTVCIRCGWRRFFHRCSATARATPRLSPALLRCIAAFCLAQGGTVPLAPPSLSLDTGTDSLWDLPPKHDPHSAC